jgi:hyperosmotically inducible periplasmic protein
MSRLIFTATRGLAVAALCLGLAGPARAADSGDAWVTTKAKIALLTSDGVSAWDVNVDTQDGNVTIHGKVNSEAEKTKAESVVRKLDGVKTVRNLLQVVPKSEEKAVKATDGEIKDRVEGAIKNDPTLKDESIKVASVNQGVVLLSGKATTLDRKLRAIEAAAAVGGVKRVATEIRTEPE